MSYAALQGWFERVGHLGHAQAMLSWDEAVIMPPGGGAARAESLAELARIRHDRVSDARVGDWIAAARTEADLDRWQRANVDEIERTWLRARALPEDLVAASSRASTLCEQAWRTARPRNDWDAIAAPLAEVVGLARERAGCLGEALGQAPYDALLDGYEPGMSREVIDPVFSRLKETLPAIVDAAVATQRDPVPLPGPFDERRQAELAETLMRRLGFDFERGRLDTSHHPFCGGRPDDVRITTRYSTADPLESLFAVLHETGHALYEQGLPRQWRGQPVGGSGGMALHESQSLFLERQVCRGGAFLRFAAPVVRDAFGGDPGDPAWSVGNLTRMAARVRPGRIRVEADEVTYPLHIALRYEIEQALVAGEMPVRDVPEAWNARMRSYLGIDTSGDYRDGPMQDVHWFAGLVGYFPTYTLGALTAAQLFSAAARDLPGLDDAIARGDFGGLREWLRARVHSWGRLRGTLEIVRTATGGDLGVDAFLAHLERRYLG